MVEVWKIFVYNKTQHSTYIEGYLIICFKYNLTEYLFLSRNLNSGENIAGYLAGTKIIVILKISGFFSKHNVTISPGVVYKSCHCEIEKNIWM